MSSSSKDDSRDRAGKSSWGLRARGAGRAHPRACAPRRRCEVHGGGGGGLPAGEGGTTEPPLGMAPPHQADGASETPAPLGCSPLGAPPPPAPARAQLSSRRRGPEKPLCGGAGQAAEGSRTSCEPGSCRVGQAEACWAHPALYHTGYSPWKGPSAVALSSQSPLLPHPKSHGSLGQQGESSCG